MSGPVWGVHVADFVAALGLALDEESIQHCFLRWRSEIRDLEGDIDILTLPGSLGRAVAASKHAARKFGGVPFFEVRRGCHHHLFVFFPGLGDFGTKILTLDFQIEIAEGSRTFLRAEEVLGQRIVGEGVWIPDRLCEAALLIVRGIAGKKYFKPLHWILICAEFSKCNPTATEFLSDLVGTATACGVVKCIAQGDRDGALAFKNAVLATEKRRSRSVYRKLPFRIARRILWFVKPPGLLIEIRSPHLPSALKLSEMIHATLAGTPLQSELFRQREIHKSRVFGCPVGGFLAPISKTVVYFKFAYPVVARNGTAIVLKEVKKDNLSLSLTASVGGICRRYLPLVARYMRITISGSYIEETGNLSRQSPNMGLRSDADIGRASPDTFSSARDRIDLSAVRSAALSAIQKPERMLFDVPVFTALVLSFRRLFGLLSKMMTSICPARGRLTVAVIGLDGAGKSTLVGRLENELVRRGVDYKTCYLGYAHFRLQVLKWIEGRRRELADGISRKLLTILYLALIPIEFLVRRHVGRHEVMLTDRHPIFEPVFSKERRNPYDALIAALCPVPDVVLYLKGDTHQLWSRKKESTFEDYCARQFELERRVKRVSGRIKTIEIDTTGRIDDAFERICTTLSRNR